MIFKEVIITRNKLMAEDNESLLKSINKSGFLFQVKIEDLINKTRKKSFDDWKLAAHEYRWVDLQTGFEGFIDIILENGLYRLVIECKKVDNANWIFLHNKSSVRASLAWTYKRSNMKDVSGFGDFCVSPETPESSFCIVRGQGENDKPMLERIAGLLLRATESLANDEFKFKTEIKKPQRIYCPVIITNATINVCYFDPKNIDLSTGKLHLDDCKFETVPSVRFRKGLSTSGYSDRLSTDFQSANVEQERTVFIVNSNHLIEFLGQIWIKELGFEGWPWFALEQFDG
jgi:hypothetical protein